MNGNLKSPSSVLGLLGKGGKLLFRSKKLKKLLESVRGGQGLSCSYEMSWNSRENDYGGGGVLVGKGRASKD